MKYYVVWRGHKTGIFDTWDECKKQVENYPSPQYKSFPNLAQAELAFSKSPSFFTKQIASPKNPNIEANSICVDAACSGNPGIMEYRGVDTLSKKEIFRKGPYREGTNNIGEFLALVHGIAYLTKSKQDKIIYTDSATAMAWVRNKKAKTKLEETTDNTELFTLIQRAENYLRNSNYTIDIRKWDTEHWGEIPADFGRK